MCTPNFWKRAGEATSDVALGAGAALIVLLEIGRVESGGRDYAG